VREHPYLEVGGGQFGSVEGLEYGEAWILFAEQEQHVAGVSAKVGPYGVTDRGGDLRSRLSPCSFVACAGR
jgi:hypothetical protein